MSSQVTAYSAEQVCSLLGIPNTCTVPMPDTSSLKPGEVLLWYPGWTLTQLRNSCLGKLRMEQEQDWYDHKSFSGEPGYYAVQLRVPSSTRKNWQEQLSLLSTSGESYQPAPVAIAATALLLHLQVADSDLLRKDWCRCVDESPHKNCRFALTVVRSRLAVFNYWNGNCIDDLWLAASRKL